jgi:hypothetical protein
VAEIRYGLQKRPEATRLQAPAEATLDLDLTEDQRQHRTTKVKEHAQTLLILAAISGTLN